MNTSGGISQQHGQIAQDCQKCHDPAVKLDPLNPAVAAASLDANCEKCHTQHTFHQADLVVDHSCTACHHEHLGTGRMQPVADINCLSCHGNAGIMASSAEKARQLPASDFKVIPKDISSSISAAPATAGLHAGLPILRGRSPGLPDQRDHLTDPNTLKFNHKLHLTGDIPMVNGQKLDCAYCHKPDSRGSYMQPISYAKNCQACHALQIDPTLPGFQIPHPSGPAEANSVRDFC